MKSGTRKRLAAAASVLWLAAAPLAAHDPWIAPSSFHPALGERVELALRVGHPQEFEEQPRDPRRIVRFEFRSPGASAPQAVLGIDGKSPAGLFKAKQPGLHLLRYESDHAFVEIEPAKYADFLREEGLTDVLAERERRGESALPGRDSYARFDKALLCVADGPTTGFDRAVGMPLELVLATDPFAWKPAEPLTFRLELAGQPLADRQVKLVRLTAPHLVELVRTDARGLATFRPPSTGPFCAFALHQRRATPERKLEGDWEGLWTSFSFELGPPPPRAAAKSDH